MSYRTLSETLDFGVSEHIIRQALEKRGFHRRIAMRKPPISEKNQKIRVKWAEEHVNWSDEQWRSIL
jgi:hypothetical protein